MEEENEQSTTEKQVMVGLSFINEIKSQKDELALRVIRAESKHRYLITKMKELKQIQKRLDKKLKDISLTIDQLSQMTYWQFRRWRKEMREKEE